ncbi:MAG TPA: hypothetical protein DHN33_10300 [Eubacteriaceae bacterium]|nr:hypothetical protein [Eubacteriaceae bacterium]
MLIHAAVKSLYQPIKAHLWYVYAYLGIMIVLPYISMIARGMNRKLENRFILLWLFFSGASYVLRHLLLLRQWDISVDNPIPIVQGTYYLGYFIAGHIIYKRLHGKVRESKRTRLYVLGYLFSILVLIFGTYAISLNQGYYYEFAYGYRNLFTITASCFLFAGIAGREESLREGSKKILDKLSKASLGVYLVHLIFLELLQKNIMLMNFHPLAGIPILVLVVFVFSYISVYLMQKVPIIQKFV